MTEEDGPSLADLSNLKSMKALTLDLAKASDAFGKSISGAFVKGVVDGRRFEDVLRSVGRSLSQSLLKSALKPLQSGISNLLGGGISSLSGLFSGGGAGLAPTIAPFADGGVIAAPSYFAMGRGLGLMGESGPEAIMPLSRGADGKLGVSVGGEARRPVSVSVQIATPDVESFRRSEAQVAAAIARAVARGNRAL